MVLAIDVSIGREDPVRGLGLCVHGASDQALVVIHRIAGMLGCVVHDCSSGEILRPGDMGTWHEYQQWRDRALGTSDNREPGT
ncbi:hotdog family protein [Thermomonospora echinospora]|uniref:hypothetical protein n=1 Tax=Thermomonospora echinospora TaxID=1992 RepID=UPI0013569371|nr:hypothetical protein [Thermomonospora echinospora]